MISEVIIFFSDTRSIHKSHISLQNQPKNHCQFPREWQFTKENGCFTVHGLLSIAQLTSSSRRDFYIINNSTWAHFQLKLEIESEIFITWMVDRVVLLSSAKSFEHSVGQKQPKALAIQNFCYYHYMCCSMSLTIRIIWNVPSNSLIILDCHNYWSSLESCCNLEITSHIQLRSR